MWANRCRLARAALYRRLMAGNHKTRKNSRYKPATLQRAGFTTAQRHRCGRPFYGHFSA